MPDTEQWTLGKFARAMKKHEADGHCNGCPLYNGFGRGCIGRTFCDEFVNALIKLGIEVPDHD